MLMSNFRTNVLEDFQMFGFPFFAIFVNHPVYMISSYLSSRSGPSYDILIVVDVIVADSIPQSAS